MTANALVLPPSLTRLYERYGRILPKLAEVVFVVLIAIALARLVWLLVPMPPESAIDLQAPVTSAPTASKGVEVGQILAAHLFGQYQAPKDPVIEDIQDAPDTRLNLTLFGILAATADRGSRALISAPSVEDKPYAIGDDVVKGVRLQAIFPDRVILARAGQLETLRLKKDEGGTSQLGGAPSRAAAAPTNDPISISGDTAAMLSDIREKLLADPGQAANYVRVQPASEGGQLQGYRLYPGRNRAAFTAVGLRPGDLVTQVNGIQLNNANTALQMLGQLSQASNLSVVVKRGGREQTMNITLN